VDDQHMRDQALPVHRLAARIQGGLNEVTPDGVPAWRVLVVFGLLLSPPLYLVVAATVGAFTP
jgi:hypothetical protein